MGDNAAKRRGMVDLCRFIFIIAVMLYHLPFISSRINYEDALFYDGWIYVEFFFILSGYFTARHILNGRYNGAMSFPSGKEEEENNFAKLSIIYVWNKFKRMLPYIWTSVIMMFIIKIMETGSHFKRNFVWFAEKAECSMLLITLTGFGSTSEGKTNALNPPVWYLSAMFLALPAVCMLLMNKKTRNVYGYYLT